MAKNILGIDPGKFGGIAELRPGRDTYGLDTYPLPQTGRKLFELLEELAPVHVYIEKVQGRGGWAATANFNFGHSLGRVVTTVEILQLPHTLVPPQTWQKTALAGMDRSDPKAAAAKRFEQLFPGHVLVGNKEVRKGMVDAALIAWHGRTKS